MRLHNIRIRDFKSLYGDNYFDFDTLDGLVKLSGAIGSGKSNHMGFVWYYKEDKQYTSYSMEH